VLAIQHQDHIESSAAPTANFSVLLNDRLNCWPKMAEAIFIETLRRYMEELPPEQTGWLAGARDPIVGAVLGVQSRREMESA